MEKKIIPWPIRVIGFMISLCLILNLISGPLIYPYSDDAYGWTRAIYEEKQGSLDAVFIGTSNTVTFWVPLFAWKNHGIASCNLANNGGKLECFRYLIEEARKTQPDALYVISLGNPSVIISTIKWVHWATDYMKPSYTKLRLFMAYCKYNAFSLAEKVEILLPLFCYHSRWEELKSDDFSRTVFAKGATFHSPFLYLTMDITDSVRIIKERAELEDETEEALIDLLDYLDNNQVRVLFINPPQFSYSDEEFAKANTMMDLIENRGYPVLRTREMLEEIGLDYSEDYYDKGHTNIHGAAKYTEFISQYLINSYNLKDKRSNPDYSSFDVAYREYLQLISSLVLDFEIDGSKRNTSLLAPDINLIESEDGRVCISWCASPDADGYLIYRQRVISENKETAWERVADLDAEKLEFTDLSLEMGNKYYYAVIPYNYTPMAEHTDRSYGDFNILGVSVGMADPVSDD